MCKASCVLLTILLPLCAFIERKIWDAVYSFFHLIVFVFCICIVFSFCWKFAILSNKMQYNLQSQTKPSIFTYGNSCLNISSVFQLVTGNSGWASAETHQHYLCAVWQTPSLRVLSQRAFLFCFVFFLCAQCRQSLLSCQRILRRCDQPLERNVPFCEEMICQDRLD